MTDDRDDRQSDAPADLSRERETFVRQFLRRGFEITETVISENQELRDTLERLREENGRLRAQLASNDAIRDLIRKIEELEVERRALSIRSDELAESSRESEQRSMAVEAELHDLANLYIAATHLHSTLSLKGVVKHLAELLQQLVGAERFAIYVADPNGKMARSIYAEGMEAPEVIVGEAPTGLVMAMRVPKIEDAPHPAGSLDAPVATVPMLVRDVCVGAITIVSVFPQKERWAGVDREFLGLLGSHGGTALMAASLQADRSADLHGPGKSNTYDPLDALRNIHEHLARFRDAG